MRVGRAEHAPLDLDVLAELVAIALVAAVVRLEALVVAVVVRRRCLAPGGGVRLAPASRASLLGNPALV